MMNKYIEMNKYRKQLNYIDKLFNILQDDDDGGLYSDFSNDEERKFINFIDFITNIQINTENKLKLVEEK